VTALAVFGAMVVTAQAENQPPSSPPTASGPVKKRTVLHKASVAECEKKAPDLASSLVRPVVSVTSDNVWASSTTSVDRSKLK
jgi:hypothetical protein